MNEMINKAELFVLGHQRRLHFPSLLSTCKPKHIYTLLRQNLVPSSTLTLLAAAACHPQLHYHLFPHVTRFIPSQLHLCTCPFYRTPCYLPLNESFFSLSLSLSFVLVCFFLFFIIAFIFLFYLSLSSLGEDMIHL